MLPRNPLWPTPISTPDPPDDANNQQLATTAWGRRNLGGGGLTGPYSFVLAPIEVSQEHVGAGPQPLTRNGADGLIDANAILFTDPGFYTVEMDLRMVQRSGTSGTVGDNARFLLSGCYWFPGGTGTAVCQRVNGLAENVDQPLATLDRVAAAANWRAYLGVALAGSVWPSGGGTAPLTADAILPRFAIGETGKTVRAVARITVSCVKT